MNRKEPGRIVRRLSDYMGQVDWPLLAFLVLIVDVKLLVKIAAIGLAFLLHRGAAVPRALIRKGWMGFYVAMPVLAGIDLLLSAGSLSVPALLSFGLGCCYWLLALAAAWHVFIFVQQVDRDKIHRTLEVFFILHITISLIALLWICIDCGSINPYTYQGLHQKYFISTGDFIRGISFDSSVTGALISAFGLFYFLYRGRYGLSLACMIVLLLTGSNFIDLLLGVIFLLIFIFRTDRVQKSMILVYLLAMVVFWGKLSPQNKDYAQELLNRIEGLPASVYIPALHPKFNEFAEKPDVVLRKRSYTSFRDSVYTPAALDSLHRQYAGWDRSGKWIAFRELGDFFRLHPAKLLLGTGMGNFSSRLAFRTTGLNIGGGYPRGWRYLHPFFRDYYLYIYLYYYTRDQGRHSVVNSPDSVYLQLLGEYGVAGLICFLFFYVSFFGTNVRRLTYGLPLLLLLGAAFFMEYWFEQLSIIVLFELLLLLDKANYVKC